MFCRWRAMQSSASCHRPAVGTTIPRLITLFASNTSSADQAHLRAAAASTGAPGQHPAIIIDVAVCGTGPFPGVVVMAGAARPRSISVQPTIVGDQTDLGRHTNHLDAPAWRLALAWGWTLSGPFRRAGVDPQLDDRPAMPFHLRNERARGDAVPTTWPTSRTHPSYRRLRVLERAPHPQTWPGIGATPGLDPNELGELVFDALPGTWSRLLRTAVSVSAGSVPSWVVPESSRACAGQRGCGGMELDPTDRTFAATT